MVLCKLKGGKMSGTKAGGIKAAKTVKEIHGDDFYKLIGRKGGLKRGIAKGFALMTPEKRAECGRIGGSISRRGKAKHD